MGRRSLTTRARLALLATVVFATALAACGGNADPYAVLNQARNASYERIQVNLGFTVSVPPSDFGGEFQNPGANMNVDPNWITAALDTTNGRAYLRLAIPVNQLGLPPQALIGIPVDAIDLEAVLAGSDLYVKSPLVPMALQNGLGGAPIEGDLTGWVRFAGAGALGPMLPLLLGGGLFGGGGVDIPELPLPSPGDVNALKSLLNEAGATVEYAGTESLNGVELHHLKGGVRIATLAGSRPFLNFFGMTRDQVQSLIDLEGQVGISTELWVNKTTGRLATLRIDGTNAEATPTKVAIILRISDPAPDISFDPPATFADVDISRVIQDLSGFGAIGGGGMVGGGVAVPAPTAPQDEIDDILDDIGDEVGLPSDAP